MQTTPAFDLYNLLAGAFIPGMPGAAASRAGTLPFDASAFEALFLQALSRMGGAAATEQVTGLSAFLSTLTQADDSVGRDSSPLGETADTSAAIGDVLALLGAPPALLAQLQMTPQGPASAPESADGVMTAALAQQVIARAGGQPADSAGDSGAEANQRAWPVTGAPGLRGAPNPDGGRASSVPQAAGAAVHDRFVTSPELVRLLESIVREYQAAANTDATPQSGGGDGHGSVARGPTALALELGAAAGRLVPSAAGSPQSDGAAGPRLVPNGHETGTVGGGTAAGGTTGSLPTLSPGDASIPGNGAPDGAGHPSAPSAPVNPAMLPAEGLAHLQAVHAELRSHHAGEAAAVPSQASGHLLGAEHADHGLAFGHVLHGHESGALGGAEQSGRVIHTPADLLPQQIVRAAHLLAREDGGSVQLRLQPESLGRLTVHVMQDHDVVRIELTAQSHQVREVLQTHLPQLKQQLADQGLALGGLTVSVETGEHREAGPHDRGNNAWKPGGTPRGLEPVGAAPVPASEPAGAALGHLDLVA